MNIIYRDPLELYVGYVVGRIVKTPFANEVAKSIIVKTPESFSMTSSVIGFFIKVIFQDKVSIHVYVKDDRLYSLLEDLNLIETFKVKKY